MSKTAKNYFHPKSKPQGPSVQDRHTEFRPNNGEDETQYYCFL